MRSELNQYELVESYITDSLSQEQRSLFQKDLLKSTELQEQLEFQTLAIQASRRIALRAEILSATKGSSGGGWSTGVIIGIAIALIALTSALAYFSSVDDTKPAEKVKPASNQPLEDTPCLEESVHELATLKDDKAAATIKPVITYSQDEELNTWIPMKKQSFSIDAAVGGTVEGEDGTLIIVPSNAFVDHNNELIQGQVEFELVEALKWEDMLAYNLTTENDGKALSTGGMIRVQPYVDGKKVKINPNRPVYIEIPTDNFDPEMVAWEGEVKNGNINWKNPEPLKRFLTKIDLAILEFLPEGFDDEVESRLPYKNHKTISDELVDSLYYSLSDNCAVDNAPVDPVVETSNRKSKTQSKTDGAFELPIKIEEDKRLTRLERKRNKNSVSVPMDNINAGNYDALFSSSVSTENYCYLDPLSIKTIRTDEFKNSFIATKEFEVRLKVIHSLKNSQEVFDVYIANLDKDLYISDEKAAALLSGADKLVFEKFAGEKATNVKGSIYDKQLQTFYNSKRSTLAAAQKKLQDKYRNKSMKEIESLMASLRVKQGKTTTQKTAKGGTKLKVAPRPFVASLPVSSVATQQTYAVPWFKSAWVNCDKYMTLLSKGKPVDVSITAEDKGGYSKLYQSNGYLRTIVSLQYNNGKSIARFPDPMLAESKTMENSFCIGITKKDGLIYYAAQKYNPKNTKDIQLSWKEVTEQQLYASFKSMSPYADKMVLELRNEQKQIEKAIARKIKFEAERKVREEKEAIERNEKEAIRKEQQAKIDLFLEKQRAEADFIEALKKSIDRCNDTEKTGGVSVAMKDSISKNMGKMTVLKTNKIIPTIAGISFGTISIEELSDPNGLVVHSDYIVTEYVIQFNSCKKEINVTVKGFEIPKNIIKKIKNCGETVSVQFSDIKAIHKTSDEIKYCRTISLQVTI